MKSSFKKLPGSKIALEVTLDAAEFKQYYDAVEADALAQIELKGFRRGQAPRELAEQAIDREKVFTAAAEAAVKRTLHDASEDEHWTIIDQPKIEIIEASPRGERGLRYTAELTLFPEVTLGDYRKIARKIFSETREVMVAPAEVERSLMWLRGSRASIVKVNRAARPGDLLEADFEGYVDGKPITAVRGKGDRFVLGESGFLPDFDRNFEDRTFGESFRFSFAAPAAHWHKELEGKTVEILARVNAVYERIVPELTDEFARGLGPHFSDAAALRRNVAEGLQKEKEEREREQQRVRALREIERASRMDIPAIMIERTLDRMAAEAKPLLEGSGKSDAEIRVSLAPRARESVAAELVLYGIAEREHLNPTPEEVATEAQAERLDPKERYDYSYGVAQRRTVFVFLEAQAGHAPHSNGRV